MAALVPAAREPGSLELRWISSTPSSSAMSDLSKGLHRPVQVTPQTGICNRPNQKCQLWRPANVCGNVPLAHNVGLGGGVSRGKDNLITFVPTTRRGIWTSPMSVTEIFPPSQDSATGFPDPDSALVTWRGCR